MFYQAPQNIYSQRFLKALFNRIFFFFLMCQCSLVCQLIEKASKSAKTRNTATSAQRPSTTGASPDQHDEATAALSTEAFRQELLVSLHEDIGDIIKTDIRSTLGEEMVGVRADINAVRVELQTYQSLVATELATLKAITGEMEKSLSACTDNIVIL